jgi:hypothetical protein
MKCDGSMTPPLGNRTERIGQLLNDTVGATSVEALPLPYLVACAESSGVNRIASFDRSIDRVGTIERIEPPAA